MLIFCNTITLIGYSLVAFGAWYASLLLIFAGRIFGGFLGPTLNVVQASLADISTNENKAANFGITGVAFGFGFLSGVLLVAGLSVFPWFSYPLAFFISSFITLLNLFFLKFIFTETLEKTNYKKLYLWSGVGNVKKAFFSKKYRLIFTVIFLLAIGFAFFTQFVQYYLMEAFDMNVRDVSLVFAYLGFVGCYYTRTVASSADNALSTKKSVVDMYVYFCIELSVGHAAQNRFGFISHFADYDCHTRYCFSYRFGFGI